MGCDLGSIRCQVGIAIAGRPPEAAEDDLVEEWFRPDILPMGERCIEDSALAMLACPRCRKSRTLVAGTLHALRLLNQDHMQVGREVLQRVPFLVQSKGGAELADAGEVAIGHAHRRLLLRAVLDEFTAKHGDIRIDVFLALIDVALALAVE